MTTDEFERIVSDFYGDRVESYDHKGSVSSVTFADGITAEIERFFPDDAARNGIFFLCDMWAGLNADRPVSDAWIKEAVTCAREVQIGKLLIDGKWDDGSLDEGENA